MTKRGQLNKNWKRRYVVLRSDCTLSYYKSGAIQLKPKVCNARARARVTDCRASLPSQRTALCK